MKKVFATISLILTAVICLALFAGCSGTADKYIVLEDNFGAEEYAIGFRKTDNAFALRVQEILDEMIADGTAGEIAKKWFGEDITIVKEK